MTKCASCGRNIKYDSPIGNGGSYCQDCSDLSGNLLPFSDVLENFANHFMNTLGYDIAVSRNAAMEILKRQPAWEPMFKKEEKMRTKKRVLAIIGGALALVLAVTGIIYGFYRYFRAPSDLFIDNQPQIIDYQRGNITFSELKADKRIQIKFVLEEKNLVFFTSWNSTGSQDYMFDLENGRSYRLPSKEGEYSFVNGNDYVWETRLDYNNPSKIKILRTIPIKDIISNCDSVESKIAPYNQNTETSRIMLCARDESRNWIISGNYVIWCEYTTRINGLDIFAANLETGKEIPVCTQPGDQLNIFACGKRVVWEDYRNPDIDGFNLYCFDIDTKKESKIDLKNQSSKIFAWRIVGDNLIYSGKDSTGLYVLDLKTGITNVITDKKLSGNEVSTKWNYKTQFYTDLSTLPTLMTSKPDSNIDFYIIWEEATGIKYSNKDFESVLVAYKKMSQISERTNYVRMSPSKNNSQRIESVTNSGITWTEFTSNSKNPDRAGTFLTADRYKGYGEFFRFFDNGRLNFFDFASKKNRDLDERYREASWNKNSAQTKDYIVWTPLDADNEEEINLRYMKIK